MSIVSVVVVEEKKCFICWEGEDYENRMFTPCACIDQNLKWAHVKCLDSWLTQDADTKCCRVCNKEYETETVRLPLLQVLKSDKGLTLYMIFVGLIPMAIYLGKKECVR